jgi:hypothetical protein
MGGPRRAGGRAKGSAEGVLPGVVLAVGRTLVIDNGGSTLKVGFAGEELTW